MKNWPTQQPRTAPTGQFHLFVSLSQDGPFALLRLSWGIFDSSLRDAGARQLDEAERTNLFRHQIAFMRLR